MQADLLQKVDNALIKVELPPEARLISRQLVFNDGANPVRLKMIYLSETSLAPEAQTAIAEKIRAGLKDNRADVVFERIPAAAGTIEFARNSATIPLPGMLLLDFAGRVMRENPSLILSVAAAAPLQTNERRELAGERMRAIADYLDTRWQITLDKIKLSEAAPAKDKVWLGFQAAPPPRPNRRTRKRKPKLRQSNKKRLTKFSKFYMQPNQTLGDYKILELIGKGGQGEVYKALDTHLKRLVAVKVFTANDNYRRQKLASFKYEARLASSLNHPNICTVYAFVEDENHTSIVMEYVEGKNLFELAFNRPLEIESALQIIVQVTNALAAAHAQGVVHRDIKPRNVMVAGDGRAVVLDFGLAKLLEDEQESLTPAEDEMNSGRRNQSVFKRRPRRIAFCNRRRNAVRHSVVKLAGDGARAANRRARRRFFGRHSALSAAHRKIPVSRKNR